MDKRRTVRPQRQSTADGQHLKVMYLRNVNHDVCTHFNKLLHLVLILLAKVKEMRCDARHFHSTDIGLGKKKKERKIIKKNLENTFIRLLTIS